MRYRRLGENIQRFSPAVTQYRYGCIGRNERPVAVSPYEFRDVRPIIRLRRGNAAIRQAGNEPGFDFRPVPLIEEISYFRNAERRDDPLKAGRYSSSSTGVTNRIKTARRSTASRRSTP